MERLVYFVEAPSVNLIKIGSSNNPKRRLAELKLLSPVPLDVLGVIGGGYEKEAAYQAAFVDLRSHGEWFHATKELRHFVSFLISAWDKAGPEARERFAMPRPIQPVADNTSVLRAVS